MEVKNSESRQDWAWSRVMRSPISPGPCAKKVKNFSNRKTADMTETNCYLPGVPRITYMPYPFQIAQSAKAIAFSYEFDHALRVIHMEGEHPDPNGFLDTWMGDSRGHWEGWRW